MRNQDYFLSTLIVTVLVYSSLFAQALRAEDSASAINQGLQNIQTEHLDPRIASMEPFQQYIRDPKWGYREAKKIEACLKLPKPLKRRNFGDAIFIDFIIDGNGVISKIKAPDYNSFSGVSPAILPILEGVVIDAIKRSKIAAPDLDFRLFFVNYGITHTRSSLVYTPIFPKDVITENRSKITVSRDPYWSTEGVKKIDDCLQLPNPFKRTALGDLTIRIDFTIDDEGNVYNFISDSYNPDYARFGISKSTFIDIKSALIEAIINSKIRALKLPGGPFNVAYLLAADRSQLIFRLSHL